MKFRLISLFVIASIVIVFIAMSARQRTDAQQPPLPLPLSESTADPVPVDREKYSPARYGIPETLGGLEVVAVISHETNPCSSEDFMQVMLQANESSLDEYLQGNTPQSVETAALELQVIYPAGFVSISGPIQDMDALFVRLEENYLAAVQDIALGGCVPWGGGSFTGTDRG
jgi:hypothetical protein